MENLNYFQSIEAEYGKIRGHYSMLSANDVNLADSWEQSGIPLHIILRAMGDVAKKFRDQNRKDSINSLKYFSQGVAQAFAEWQTSQVGKNTEPNDPNFGEDLSDFSTAPTYFNEPCSLAGYTNEYLVTLESLAARFDNDYFERYTSITLPEPLKAAVKAIHSDLLELIEDSRKNKLLSDDIEPRLAEMATGLTIPLVASISEDERAALIAKISEEYKARKLDHDSRARLLVKKLYERFGLPELTLFAI